MNHIWLSRKSPRMNGGGTNKESHMVLFMCSDSQVCMEVKGGVNNGIRCVLCMYVLHTHRVKK